jgi:DNA-binding transcriptional ArsR family regulator
MKKMRSLFHPSVDDISVEGILHALSDPIRVGIFVQIAAGACAQPCAAFLEFADRQVPKSTLSQHFKVLREAGLIRSERRGVELLNTTRCEEISGRFGPLLSSIVAAYQDEMERARKAKKKAMRRAA